MKEIILGVACFASVASAMPAQASLVREASLVDACQGDVPILIHSGMGMAIDFTQTEHSVQRAWLGDPSKVTLDFDRPLEEGSRVLFLRRISELDFTGLPATQTTMLTTVLTGADGNTVCQFPIAYGGGVPEYTNLHLTDESEVPTEVTTRPQLSLLTSTVSIDNVERGINAKAAMLGSNHPVVQRVELFIEKVREGQAQQLVARELGIEWPLIVQLSRQGASATAAPPEAVSVQDVIFQQPSSY